MKTQKRRRREHKTNYLRRIKLLKSGKPRIIFRRTNKYFIAQYIVSNEAQDKVEMGINSKHLLKYGWPEEFKGSLKSTPAAYLTGLLIGKKIIKLKLESPIVDFGMLRTFHKSKNYGFLKGIIDAGIEIKHKEETFPSEDRIKGKHLKEDFTKIFDEIKFKIDKS